MKRLMLLCCLLLCLTLPALAEELPLQVQTLLQEAHPGYTLAEVVSLQNPAIAVMSQGDSHVLCIAEEKAGQWVLAVDNPTALRQGKLPSFLWEGGSSLFWRYTDVHRDGYNNIDEYHAQRTAEGWSNVDLIAYETMNGFENTVSWQDGCIHITQGWYDQEGNPQGAPTIYPPYPMAHLAQTASLATFDVNLFPTGKEELDLQQVLDSICPGYTVVDGALGQALAVIADKADGTRRFVGCAWDGQAWHVTESTPLPEDIGCDSFHSDGDNLLIGGSEDYVTVSLQADGRWRVTYIGREDWFAIGETWLCQNTDTVLYGDLPFSTDVRALEWAALPSTWAKATAMLDQSGWATVNNPNPEDRLHLRTSPKKSAMSQGKYYNGTPVKVLARKDGWAQVDVFGVEGWMMEQYLAFGADGNQVAPAMPVLFTREDAEGRGVPLYREIGGGMPLAYADGNVQVLGIVNDNWLHVRVQDEDTAGYVQKDLLYPGNG